MFNHKPYMDYNLLDGPTDYIFGVPVHSYDPDKTDELRRYVKDVARYDSFDDLNGIEIREGENPTELGRYVHSDRVIFVFENAFGDGHLQETFYHEYAHHAHTAPVYPEGYVFTSDPPYAEHATESNRRHVYGACGVGMAAHPKFHLEAVADMGARLISGEPLSPNELAVYEKLDGPEELSVGRPTI